MVATKGVLKSVRMANVRLRVRPLDEPGCRGVTVPRGRRPDEPPEMAPLTHSGGACFETETRDTSEARRCHRIVSRRR
jgi:hypothetical protein